MSVPAALPSSPRRRLRLSVRGLMLLIVALGLAMALGQFWLANLDSDRATLSYQLRVLADPEAPVGARLAAMDATLGTRGRSARRSLLLLSSAMDDPDARVRSAAARAIGRLGERIVADAGPVGIDTVRPAARSLADAIDDPDVEVVAVAIEAIGWLDRNGARAAIDRDAFVDCLRSLLDDDRRRASAWADARRAAIAALDRLEPIEVGERFWLGFILSDPDPSVRRAAMEAALRRREAIARASRIVPDAPGWLLDAIASDSPEVREYALWSCSQWASNGGRMSPRWADPGAIGDALLGRSGEARGQERAILIAQMAVNAPEAAADFAPEVMRGLEERLDGPSEDWHFHVLALEHLGPAARPAVPVLCAAARRAVALGEPWNCERIARLVAALDPESAEAQALLGDLIGWWASTARDYQRVQMGEVIMSYGQAARPVLPRLRAIADEAGPGDPIRGEAVAIIRTIEFLGMAPPPPADPSQAAEH